MNAQNDGQFFLELYDALALLSEAPGGDESLWLKRRGGLQERKIAELDFLISALEHERWRVRYGAAEWLAYSHQQYGEIGKVVEPLISILRDDTNEDCRARAALALGKLEDRRAVDPLFDALRDSAIMVVALALDKAVKIDKTRAITVLIAVLNEINRDERFRNKVARLLKSIDAPEAQTAYAEWQKTLSGTDARN